MHAKFILRFSTLTSLRRVCDFGVNVLRLLAVCWLSTHSNSNVAIIPKESASKNIVHFMQHRKTTVLQFIYLPRYIIKQLNKAAKYLCELLAIGKQIEKRISCHL